MSRNRSGLLHLSISWVKECGHDGRTGNSCKSGAAGPWLRSSEVILQALSPETGGTGLPVTEEEESFALAFAARKTEVEILDYCHIDLIPAVLYPLLCDRAAGGIFMTGSRWGSLKWIRWICPVHFHL